MATKKMRISEKLWDSLEKDECNIDEVVQLMSLDEEELITKFAQEVSLRIRYLDEKPNEISFIAEATEDYSEPETESSDEETYFQQIRMERGESSETKREQQDLGATRKRKIEERNPFYTPPVHKGIPSSTGRGTEISTLNLDCISSFEERKVMIDKWFNEISLIIQTNKESFDTSLKVLTLMEHRTEGIAKSFIKQATWDILITPEKIIEEVLTGFYTMFIGLDYALSAEKEEEKRIKKAEELLIKSQLCNICELDNFTCFYEKQINQLKFEDFPKWIELYLGKIPIIGKQSKERWDNEKSFTTKYSLAFAKRIIQEEIAKYCDFQRTSKKLKNFSKKCCSKNSLDPLVSFGCRDTKKKDFKKSSKYKAYKKKKTLKKLWKKKKRKFTPGKYFSKKKPEKFCPQGRKKCRCWICTEEGHYANECPNRKSHQEKVKILIHGMNEGYYPLEDAYTGNLEVFSMEIIEETTSEEESTTDSDSSSSDDEQLSF
ncbi:unnamed protein product [Figwort mosaic virus]|uniref:Probable capsid protein n=1 Tax=Figwort mosaic virus (strain DxS) TaxID=10650 RepID=CAPSD_FMVD|nr:unnamed protein product [Figwort mosaic virus]P09519.1 RecName: Full=Probable capsid protein; Short=CP; AltName: Full=Coat protein [Figwort mosaic virus (STRAIN DXS)]CAA29526.1 unnamed protein product [Figwort mosaic virus]